MESEIRNHISSSLSPSSLAHTHTPSVAVSRSCLLPTSSLSDWRACGCSRTRDTHRDREEDVATASPAGQDRRRRRWESALTVSSKKREMQQQELRERERESHEMHAACLSLSERDPRSLLSRVPPGIIACNARREKSKKEVAGNQ